MAKNTFGEKCRELRKRQGQGIKSLANDLTVNYTYLSKIENNRTSPSEDFIEKMARVFNYDVEELKILAGKIPEDIRTIFKENPREAVAYLRSAFGGRKKS